MIGKHYNPVFCNGNRILKVIFLIQGVFVWIIGVKDILQYECSQEDFFYPETLLCTRFRNTIWLMIGFSCLHLITATFAFFYSCFSNRYQPIICYILWTFCLSSLLFYNVLKESEYEMVTVSLAITITLTLMYSLLVLFEIGLHIYLIIHSPTVDYRNTGTWREEYASRTFVFPHNSII